MRWFRDPIVVFACAIIAGAAVPVQSSPTLADSGITQLSTSAGLLVARATMGHDCGARATFAESCVALYLNDSVLLAENNLDITNAFPSESNPQLVSIDTSAGGNHCCWTSYILDFTTSPPIILKDIGFGSKISRTTSGVVFESPAGLDALGDQLRGTYSYKLGSGRVVRVRTTPQYKTISLKDKKDTDYAPNVLADPAIREPILRLIGKDHFAAFRDSMGMSGPLEIIDDNFIVGS